MRKILGLLILTIVIGSLFGASVAAHGIELAAAAWSIAIAAVGAIVGALWMISE